MDTRRYVKESYLKILELRAAGALKEEPVRLEFSFRASEKECLLWLRDQLAKKTDLLLEYVESDADFLLKAKTKPMIIAFREVEDLVGILSSLAVQFGCSYEGWEIVV
ncbi:MAG: ribonuclease E inhibitor RraB [Planctomycetota bacterium]